MNSTEKLWKCWVNEREGIVSFHEVDGYECQLFRCSDAFWLYIRAKLTDGFRVQ